MRSLQFETKKMKLFKNGQKEHHNNFLARNGAINKEYHQYIIASADQIRAFTHNL